MSYIRAEELLPKELIEAIQQYVDGKSIYIPSREKQDWGSRTDTKRQLQIRNRQIYQNRRQGMAISALAETYSLSEKSIQRILRQQRLAEAEGADAQAGA